MHVVRRRIIGPGGYRSDRGHTSCMGLHNRPSSCQWSSVQCSAPALAPGKLCGAEAVWSVGQLVGPPPRVPDEHVVPCSTFYLDQLDTKPTSTDCMTSARQDLLAPNSAHSHRLAAQHRQQTTRRTANISPHWNCLRPLHRATASPEGDVEGQKWEQHAPPLTPPRLGSHVFHPLQDALSRSLMH